MAETVKRVEDVWERHKEDLEYLKSIGIEVRDTKPDESPSPYSETDRQKSFIQTALESNGFNFRTNKRLECIFSSGDLEILRDHGYSTGNDVLSSKTITGLIEEILLAEYQDKGFATVKAVKAFDSKAKAIPSHIAVYVKKD